MSRWKAAGLALTARGVVLFTRDLRVRDHAALSTATRECDQVVPLFVLDDRLLGSPNRTAFLIQSLQDLRRELGGGLVIRRGDAIDEIARFAPDVVYLSEDVSSFSRARIERLRQRFAVQTHAGATIVEPGAVAPSGATHYRVFTPYWRAWRSVPIPPPIEPPRPVMLPPEVEPGRLPHPDELAGARAPALAVGGARAGAAQMRRVDATRYEHLRNDLAADGTSRLSPYLHLGCISPAEAARWAAAAGAEELLRQLCWRDFFAQLLAATPRLPSVDLRPARTAWVNDPRAVTAWKHGRTGYPLVDAAMRQLLDEGWIHNRARMIAASFLVRQLQVDWRIGAAHFMAHLIDGDLASNSGNWQWVAGTGHGSRPDRYFNPTLQGRRHDPAGTYIRRFVPELASRPASSIHDPSPADRRAAGYPSPIVPPGEVADRLRARP